MKIIKFQQQQQPTNQEAKQGSMLTIFIIYWRDSCDMFWQLQYITGHYTLNNEALLRRSACRFKPLAILGMPSTGD